MNNLIKFAVGAAILGPALLASSAFASVTQTNMLVNGDVHGSAASGDVVNLSVQFTNTGVSTYQSAWVEIPGSGFPGECVDILDENQIGTHTVNINVNTLGTTEGQWTVNLRPFGINRVTTGSQPTDTDCTNPQGSTKSFPNQLKITNPISTGPTANNSGNGGVNGNGNNSGGTGTNNGNDGNGSTGGSGGSSDIPGWFNLYLQAQCVATGGTWANNACTHPAPPMPTVNPKCTAIQPYLGAAPYQYSTLGAQLQNVLTLDNPHSIPALDVTLHPNGTVPTGFFGIQTHAALSTYMSQYHCGVY